MRFFSRRNRSGVKSARVFGDVPEYVLFFDWMHGLTPIWGRNLIWSRMLAGACSRGPTKIQTGPTCICIWLGQKIHRASRPVTQGSTAKHTPRFALAPKWGFAYSGYKNLASAALFLIQLNCLLLCGIQLIPLKTGISAFDLLMLRIIWGMGGRNHWNTQL